MAATQFDRIYHGMSIDTGKFRVAASGMAWKADSEGNKDVTAIQSENIKWVQWLRVARGFQLRVGLKDHKREKFDGFAREDHDKLTTLMKNYFGVTLETIEVSFKGWNWGVADFHGEDLAFMVSDKTSFELPLRHVANSNIAGKTEVSLEFSNLTAPSKSGGSRQVGDELTEIRFFVPGTIAKLKGSDQGSDKSDNEEEDGQEEISAAQVFHDTIKEKADIGAGIGDLILSFDEVLVLTPRGRYDMDMFPDFLRLRGKTYDYKVLYQSIARLFLLPKDDQQVLFILGLSTPIRQGQTLYQYLVMQFTREEEITAELNMTDEEMEKYDKLKKNYEAPTYEVVSSVFRALSGKKIIGSGSFQSRDGHPGFKANLKAVQGDLFMLERYIFFVSKSPLLIELSDIHQVIFSRVGSTAAATGGRTFDIKIMLKSGGEYMFTSINKEEHEVTEAYLKDKKIRVKNEMVPDADLLLKAVGVDDDDEDMQSVVSDDDDDRGKRQKKPVRAGGGDDESEEEDEDFKASDSDSGSPSGSDSDTSGAETASDASGDLALTKDAKSKGKSKAKDKDGDGAHKKAVKKKPAVKKGSDAGDDDEDKKDKPKAKPKPKPKPKAKKASDDEAMDVDGEEKPKPKPKPKPKAVGASSSKPKPKGDEPMDVDEVKEKPKPKPKPKKKDAETDAEPPKKKLKKIDD